MAETKTEPKTTTDHDEIRRFVESRGGRPARVKGTGSGGDPGILNIDFPGGAGDEALEPISWNDFFRKIDAEKLAFVYQEEKASGEPSTFQMLVRSGGS